MKKAALLATPSPAKVSARLAAERDLFVMVMVLMFWYRAARRAKRR